MTELLNKISSENLIVICIVMSIVALFLAISVSIEFFNNYKRKKILKKEDNIYDSDENTDINTIKDSNIKYVEEDEELEKTKAKLELAKLKERLIKEEEEKKKLLEINLALVNNEKAKDDVKENNIEKNNEVSKLKDNISNNLTYEQLEEENAIISYDELKNSTTFGYTDEEMNKYADEKDAIISIEELEKLYKESKAIYEDKKESVVIKRVEDLPEISSTKKFQSSPFISPVYGIGINEENIQLEQTANLEKLNEEIRKTNEFLKALKELKKNLQ